MPPQKTRLDATAVAIVVLLCALWGFQQTTLKVAAAGGLPPLYQPALRSAGAAICVFAWIAIRDGRAAAAALFRLDATTGAGLIVALLFALEFITLYPGVNATSASRAVIFLYTAPFFTALGAHFFLPTERMRPRHAAGLLIAFAGVAAAFADGLRTGEGSIVGDLLCLTAGALWGATTVVIKASPAIAKAGFARALFIQLAGSAPVLIVCAILAGQFPIWPDATPLAWASLFYQTVIVAFLSYLTWFRLIMVYPASRLAGFTFLTPLFGIFAGTFLLGETPSMALFAGLAAIAVGLRLLNTK